MPAARLCDVCGVSYTRSAARIGRFCSKQCAYTARRKYVNVMEQIWAHTVVDEETGCHVWQAATVPAGYGHIGYLDREGKRRQGNVHRVAWVELRGPCAPGMHLDHYECDNPPCWNPDHLRETTPRKNVLRSKTGPSAVNARRTACSKCGGPFTVSKSGLRACVPCRRATANARNAKKRAANPPKHPRRTRAEVMEILALLAKGMSQREVADHFGVDPSGISRIACGQAHVI